MSAGSMHQLHILIFVLAVFHVTYSVIMMGLSRLKVSLFLFLPHVHQVSVKLLLILNLLRRIVLSRRLEHGRNGSQRPPRWSTTSQMVICMHFLSETCCIYKRTHDQSGLIYTTSMFDPCRSFAVPFHAPDVVREAALGPLEHPWRQMGREFLHPDL